jgi:lipopolysaccharide transport system ATP-binding protein
MSSSHPAIRVSHLGKKYSIGGPQEKYLTFRDAIVNSVKAPFRRFTSYSPQPEEFWALKDVSFDVEQGEVVGIIGRNGAGKSTLLKILSRITSPSEGTVDLYGRVGSLLEVGTGFHPELTGRENIFLSGSILGMKRREIEEKLDDIVKFSEIEKFLDTPVKRYSSGMYVRLAFAVAAHMDTEILLVDEVLAVGDAAFQKKCLGKMGDVAAKDGRTVMFVSHNMGAVQNLCEKTMLIYAGKIAGFGPTDQIVSQYSRENLVSLTDKKWDEIKNAPGNEKFKLHRASICPLTASSTEEITIRTPLLMTFEYWNLDEGSFFNLSLHIYNEMGVIVFNTAPVCEHVWNGKPFPKGLFRSTCLIPGDLLNDGFYSVELLAVKDQGIVIYSDKEILSFEISDDPRMRGAWFGKWQGIVRPNLKWTTELIKPVT